VCEGAGRCLESEDVAPQVKGLNAILRIVFVGGVAPTADLDVHFAVMLIASPVIESIHAEDSRWL
jgi:hypothetical protein